tara:strand:- start:3710 stop:3916 length:207 start_codon:yes stop_codon:yes gene_type:complete
MKSLIYKILAIFGAIFAIFQLGKRSGKTTLKNEINKQTLKDVGKAKTIDKRVSNMSLNDKLDILHGKK